MNQTDPTAAIEVWARMLCAADVHVHGDDHPTWQQLVGDPGQRIRDDYRKAARWLLPRMTVATKPAAASAVVSPPTDRAGWLAAADAAEEVAVRLHNSGEPTRAHGAWDVMDALRRRAAEAQQQPDTEAPGTIRRETAEFLLQSQQPDGTWEHVSSYRDDLAYATERLAKRQQMMPDFTFRLARRTTTVVVQPLPDVPAPVAQQTAAERDANRIVAYVLTVGTDLHCLGCTPTPRGDIWAPVTAGELEDGGLCVRCGRDLLIPQHPEAEQQPAAANDEETHRG